MRRAVSDDRFNGYRRRNPDKDDLVCYACYVYNTALSENFYPALQSLEITLRNSIHDAATKAFNSNCWFDNVLALPEQKMLEEVKDRLHNQNKPLDAGQIVASSSFGFWVSLFNTRYEQVLWPLLLEDVFPKMPRHMRTRKNLSKRLNRIRELRNRAFHYEPIWHWKNLVQHHDDILGIVGWINPAMLDMVKMVDRFPEVHERGVQYYEKALKELLNSPGNVGRYGRDR